MRHTLAGAIAVILALATPALAATPGTVAHRGTHDGCAYTENTIKAFRHCARRADALEVDMRISKDHRPVFIHDATLNRTTRATGRVDARTFKQLRRIVTEDGRGRIPSTKVLANHIAATGQTVFIDVKTWPTKKGWRILRQLPRNRVVFFSARDNRYVRKAAAYGFRSAHYSWPHEPAPSVRQARAYGTVWRASMTNTQARRYRNADVARVGGANTTAEWDRLARQSAAFIVTDRLPALRKHLR